MPAFLFAQATDAPPGLTAAGDCVIARFKGDVTWYQPGVGYKGGGGTYATGGKYDANAFHGALQLDLAKKYKCGYGKNRCYAAIEAGGRAVLVLVTDNGPMCADAGVRCPRGRYQRIADLTPKAFSALADPKRGAIPNANITLLCDAMAGYVGPLNDASRAAIPNVDFTKLPTVPGGTVGDSARPGSSGAFGNLFSGLGFGQGIGAASGRSGSGPSGDYQSGWPADGKSFGQQSSGQSSDVNAEATEKPLSPPERTVSKKATVTESPVERAATILTQPGQNASVRTGLRVVWASVGMKMCEVTDVDGHNVGSGTNGVARVLLSAAHIGLARDYSLKCTPLDEKILPITETVSVTDC